MNFRWQALIWIIVALLAVGIIYLVASPPRGEAIALQAPPTPAPLLVHVVGAVADPGLYSLPLNSRVQDVIDAAGGLTQDADSSALNLAARIEDGERILVPSVPASPLPTQVAAPEVVAPGAEPSPQTFPNQSTTIDPFASELVNINTATQEQLEELPGIGPVTAAKIIAYREEFGPFASVEAIQEVSGIGPVKFEGMKDLITVGE